MTDRPESRLAPCAEKLVYAVPAIKADAKAARLQNPVQVRKRGKKFRAAAVIFDGAPAPVAVVHKVGRIGDDKINGLVRQGF